MGEIVKFGLFTGLRPSEILESVRLINNNQTFPVYYNAEQMTLQHYKFPDIFLRHTKKAFVSFLLPKIVHNMKFHISSSHKIPSYSAIRHACNRKGITCDLRFCRKVYGSWLHQSGIASENIDFLQG
jgi:intergrase/recombinase